TASVLHTRIFALVLHPEVQEKAQAEIDTVVRWRRVPTFEDKERLAYLRAVICETMICNPVAPLGHSCGLPHVTAKDDVYEGCYIPKGGYLVAFQKICQSTGRNFPDPHLFDPDRFILSDGQLWSQAEQVS
ncbi:cytochrome P450, partial [Melanogaster broomeanus]